MSRFPAILSPAISGLAIAACTAAPVHEPRIGMIELSSSYEPLVAGFSWAKTQSLEYVFEGDPVGKWYEAALPRREAFCMRDVSHQAIGALALGLSEHTRNMMKKFAANIAETRKWCSYWEINRYDAPAPVDYRSDEDFWYNLPANFDVIQSIEKIHEWTGDDEYVTDSVFRNFYRRSLVDYVAAWDENGDGIMESSPANGYQGIPTYWEGDGPRAITGSDLVASQFAANRAFGSILRLSGDSVEAQGYLDTANRLKRYFNDQWWNAELGRFQTSILEGGAFDTTHVPLLQILPLYFGIVEPGSQREHLIENLVEGILVEVNVYLAEVYYANGREQIAFQYLMRQMDPELPRREYPENPFTAVGTTVRFFLGINPQSSGGLVETKSALVPEVEWVRVDHVPVLSNEISVRHDGLHSTRFENETGAPLIWLAVFKGRHREISVDGHSFDAESRQNEMGELESFVRVSVATGQVRVASVEGNRE